MRAAGRCGWALVVAGLACTSVPHTATDAGSDTGPDDAGRADAGSDAGTADGGKSPADGGAMDAGAQTCGLVFDNPPGEACNSDADCSTHHCAFMENGSLPGVNGPYPGICTTACNNPGSVDSCVGGYTCNYAYSIRFDDPTSPGFGAYCLPTAVSEIVSGEGKFPLGSPCWSNSDCAGVGTTCQAYNYGGIYYYTFCAPACTTEAPDCGACGRCATLNAGQPPLCVFVGPTPLGGTCAEQADCSTFFCDGFCTTPCSSSTPCPSGAVCHPFVANGSTQSLCVLPSQLGGTADGQPCTFDDQCASGSQCLQSPTGPTICTALAPLGGTCPTGSSQQTASYCISGLDCREFGPGVSECSENCGMGCPSGDTCYAPDLSTVVTLYNSTTGSPIAMANSSQTGSADPWSTIPAMALVSGTYWVTVATNYGDYVGNYQLLITDGNGTPTPVRELPESPIPNNSFANAQMLPFPVALSGVLQSSTEVDYYEFTVPSNATVTLQTLPGPPSACLPANQAGTTVLGGGCTADFNCATGLTCKSPVNLCSQTCTMDTDCGGGGNTCVDLGPGLNTCVSPADVGVLADGAACSFSWQCPSGEICASNLKGAVCALPCTLGTSTCVTGKTQCGATVDQDTAVPATACLPLGSMKGAFASTCNIQSDCAAGLTCTDGVCQQTCTKDSDCPYQSGLSSDPIVCQPCQTDADCTTNTEEGECVETGDVGELHCVLTCDAGGNCPTGFTCNPNSYPLATCLPSDGSCHIPYCQVAMGATTGQCAIPPQSFAESCTANADCTTQDCVSGLCSRACQTNTDCHCPNGDMVCHGGSCEVAAYTPEVEPNNSMATAQVLAGPLPITLLGTLQVEAGSPDVDYYSVALTAGTTVNFDLRPLCNVGDTAAYLIEVLYDGTGDYEGQSENAGYGVLDGFAVPTTGNYILQIEDVDGTLPRPLDYVLSITSG